MPLEGMTTGTKRSEPVSKLRAAVGVSSVHEIRPLHGPSTDAPPASFASSTCLHNRVHNSNCEWPQETAAHALNPSHPSQQRHLSDDAEFAEDLAIRYADAHRGPRSGHFEGMAEYGRTRDKCMAALFKVIGSSHSQPEE